MNIKIRGDKLLVTEAIKEYVESKLSKLEKYFDKHGEVNANVLLRVGGRNQIIEVTIPTNHFTLRAEESHDDLYAAIDLVVDKLERQIRKNKTRIEKRLYKENIKEINYNFELEEDEIETSNKIIKRKTLDMKPMSEEEAILQMELLGHSFFIFKNSENENVSVIYKRKDNNYGIIEID